MIAVSLKRAAMRGISSHRRTPGVVVWMERNGPPGRGGGEGGERAAGGGAGLGGPRFELAGPAGEPEEYAALAGAAQVLGDGRRAEHLDAGHVGGKGSRAGDAERLEETTPIDDVACGAAELLAWHIPVPRLLAFSARV